MRRDRYGDFRLTGAVRPSVDLQVVPRQGYRLDQYDDPRAGVHVPVLAAAVSAERLFDVFLAALQPLGPVVDVILETSHATPQRAPHRDESARHRDLVREDIDLPVLLSHFCDFEDLLLNDGCTGVAVVSSEEAAEVQFDEHKLLIIYARDLRPFEQVLQQAGIAHDDGVRLITEGEHLHTTEPGYAAAFEQLCCRVGAGVATEPISNW
jgi:hypothetical protein